LLSNRWKRNASVGRRLLSNRWKRVTSVGRNHRLLAQAQGRCWIMQLVLPSQRWRPDTRWKRNASVGRRLLSNRWKRNASVGRRLPSSRWKRNASLGRNRRLLAQAQALNLQLVLPSQRWRLDTQRRCTRPRQAMQSSSARPQMLTTLRCARPRPCTLRRLRNCMRTTLQRQALTLPLLPPAPRPHSQHHRHYLFRCQRQLRQRLPHPQRRPNPRSSRTAPERA